MRILSAEQHRALDRATLRRDNIDGLTLMERAATAFVDRFVTHYGPERSITVFAGPGNNGGDGLAVARLLRLRQYSVRVILCRIGDYSEDNLVNQRRARDVSVNVSELRSGEPLPRPGGDLLLDALFGTGLGRPIEGYWADLVATINDSSAERVAIDLPSGMYADRAPDGPVVRAHRTISLGLPKLALFAPASTEDLGVWELAEFDLDRAFAAELPTGPGHPAPNYLLTSEDVAVLPKVRLRNDHKGTFGHALLIAGSFGKMGAAIISARAVLRGGAGMVTTHLPLTGYQIMQISFPEAMCSVDPHKYHFTTVPDTAGYAAVGVGPGLGTDPATAAALYRLLEDYHHPLVIDADALNLLARAPERYARLAPGSILTPHPKEFARLFGETPDDFARWELQRDRAVELGVVILLKTGYTTIATPDGALYFNSTGNPGMGTAGTGDALTGLLTGLLAQGYAPEDAARLGVYLHGLAGDLASETLEQESLLAEDVVSHLGRAFGRLRRGRTASR